MKKLLSVFAAVAMLFGFASCSGDLHDDVKIDPNAMKGNWFYTVLDVSGATDKINIIFNNNGEGLQTVDIKDIDPSVGSIAYVWGAKTNADPADVSTRTDCPDKSSLGGEGKLVVYCFSNAAKVSIWAWETDGPNFTGGEWPGQAMETDAVIPMVDVVIEGATVTANGLPEVLNGTTLYFTGAFNNWANPGDEGTVEGVVTDGSISITLPKLETQVESGAAQEIIVEGKFAGTGWNPGVGGEYAEGAFGWDVTNIKLAITPTKKAIVGTFVDNPADGKYVCTWVVE